MYFLETEQYQHLEKELLEIIHLFHSRGWSMATSTNYSFRNPSPNETTYTISRSGVDKLQFKKDDFMLIDAEGVALPIHQNIKSSAETLLHTYLYENLATQCVLHTHSKSSTIYSLIHQKDKVVKITGFELLKGIRNVGSHEAEIKIPIFQNSQDMKQLVREITAYYDRNPETYGFLLAGHGLYAWGNSIAEAKRHTETFEFLFDCLLDIYKMQKTKD
ncbi:MAG: methylthioribulose 1-phosphate dehydratase [Cytophagia bacterium]|nr:MAG: methylthioribulose 1-phosphate dehydratase [Cytophagia bacterium]TAG41504.1 MAG: methylthioribulose 1-phosphate dehydratase [Cytophagia bacterium]